MIDKDTIDRMVKDANFVGPDHPYAPELFNDLCCHVKALAWEVEKMQVALRVIAALADTGTVAHREIFAEWGLDIPGWRVVEEMRKLALCAIAGNQ